MYIWMNDACEFFKIFFVSHFKFFNWKKYIEFIFYQSHLTYTLSMCLSVCVCDLCVQIQPERAVFSLRRSLFAVCVCMQHSWRMLPTLNMSMGVWKIENFFDQKKKFTDKNRCGPIIVNYSWWKKKVETLTSLWRQRLTIF